MSDKYYHITLRAHSRTSPFEEVHWTLVIDCDPLEYVHKNTMLEYEARERGEKSGYTNYCVLYSREITKEEYDKYYEYFS